MRFEYDEKKSRTNVVKHAIDFETAMLVFDDPYALTLHDMRHSEYEERYITLGEIAPGVVLFVVHTWLENNNEEVIRLISARAATSKEKQAYEKAHKRTAETDRSHRHEKRRRN